MVKQGRAALLYLVQANNNNKHKRLKIFLN
jgi:hypothetical protein